MPNSQASSSLQQTNSRHNSRNEECTNQQTISYSEQATPRQKTASDQCRKGKSSKKGKSKDDKQEDSEYLTLYGAKQSTLSTKKTTPGFGTEEEEEDGRAREPSSAQVIREQKESLNEPSDNEGKRQEKLKDSWDDPSDNEGQVLEEDLQEHQLQRQTTEEYPPLHQEEKQQEKTTLLTKVAKADMAIMKALIKISTCTGQEEGVATQIDTIISEHSKLKKLTIEQFQEIAYLKGKISVLEEATSKNEHQEREKQTELQPPVEAEERKSYALVLTSETMGKQEMAELIKTKINPTEAGLPDATMREGRQEIILTTASKESSGKLERILRSRNGFQQVKVNKPKQNRYNIKVIGVDDELANDALPQRIIEQNRLECNPEDILVRKSWKGKQETTLVLALNR
ncbi:hypothetical protein MRX96_046676, partial [Rhipicephalus microplus]